MLHALWDAGLIVGQTVSQRARMRADGGDDLKEKTAILDARFLAGDEAALGRARQGADRRTFSTATSRSFSRPSSRKPASAIATYGDSIYLLEPQLKEGEGGLRDLHTALWLAKVKYKVHSLDELVQKAIISEAELNEVLRGAATFSFACAIRCIS